MTFDSLQLAIKYATKNRRMQLATRISALAYEKQEQEEMEENKKTQETCGFSQAASEDIFASQDEDIDMETPENPFLVAEAKKNNPFDKAYSGMTPSSAMGSRNPFKKSTTPSSAPSGSRSGFVFDDITKKDVTKGGRTRPAFGGRKIADSNPQSTPPTSRTVILGGKKTDKENKS